MEESFGEPENLVPPDGGNREPGFLAKGAAAPPLARKSPSVVTFATDADGPPGKGKGQGRGGITSEAGDERRARLAEVLQAARDEAAARMCVVFLPNRQKQIQRGDPRLERRRFVLSCSFPSV